MKIVSVSDIFPLPTDHGSAIRLWGFAQALDAAFDTHHLLRKRADTTDDEVASVRDALHGTVEVFAPRPRLTSTWDMARKWWRAWREGAPPWAIDVVNSDLGLRLGELAPCVEAAVFLLEEGLYALSLDGRGPVRVVDRHEIMSVTYPQRDVSHLGMRERFRHRLIRPLVHRIERRLADTVEVFVVTSEEDGERLREAHGRHDYITIPSGIRSQPPWPPPDCPPTIGYLGSLDYGPNVDGLLRFLREGWPEIANECGLVLAGESPDARIQAAASGRVDIMAIPNDFDTFLASFRQRVTAAIVPLWSGGAGVKLKTLTLLGSAIPTALTTTAAQGIPLRDGVHCLIREAPRDLARAALELAQDPVGAQQMGRAGRQVVEEGFTIPKVSERFVEVVSSAVQERRQGSRR